MAGTTPPVPAVVTLPNATNNKWYAAPVGAAPGKSRMLTIYHRREASGTCTVQAVGVQTIDGAASFTLAPGQVRRLRSDGANWFSV